MAAAVASASIDVSINHAFKTLGTVKALKHELDKDYFDDIEKIFEKAMKDVTDRTSKFLCNLHVTQPNVKVLKKIIDMVPSSLKPRDDDAYIPIQAAAYHDHSHYVLPLAEAAIEHNVFEEEERGGLLREGHGTDSNALQYLASGSDSDTLKKLRSRNLLMKEDIIAEDLIFHAVYSGNQKTINCLLELDPDALNTNLRKGKHRGLPITHAVIEFCSNVIGVSILAKVAMKYHQYDIGLIFQKDENGTTAIGRAIDTQGEIETFNGLNEHLIPYSDPEVPILHHCAKDAPHLMDTFTKYYPSAIFLRDEHGRTLRQAELASGKKTFAKNAFFFATITDADLRVADPKEDLYPFMMAASSMDTMSISADQTENDDDLNDGTNSNVLIPQIPRCDLSAVYYLIRRDPSLAYGGRRVRNNRKRKITKVL